MRKTFLLVLVVSALSVQFSVAQSFTEGKISPQTAAFLSKIKSVKPNTPAMAKLRAQYNVQNGTYINTFIRLAHANDAAVLEKHGVKVNTRLGDLITAQVNIQDMAEIAALPEVKSIEIAARAHRRMDKARAAANVDKVQSGEGLTSPLKGKDVVVGVIDVGIQYAHVAFYDKARKNLRVKKVWDQNKKGTPPAGYTYGTEYSTKETIVAAGEDTKEETHGTHVAGIAAGAYSTTTNSFHGIAPEADLILVSASDTDESADNTAMIDGIKYVYDYAASVNRPAIVNLSWGLHVGPHDGTSLFDEACDRLQGEGKLLVGAAGNEGGDKFHVSKSFTAENQELKSLVEFLQSDETSGEDILKGAVDIWGDADKNYSVKICVFNENDLTMKYISRSFNPELLFDTTFVFNTAAHGAKGKVMLYTERNARNKRANTYIDVDLSSIGEGNYVGFIITATDGTVHAWADDWYAGLTDDGEPNSTWAKGDNNYSVGEIGGTGKRIISVGAFVTKNTYKPLGGEILSTGLTLDSIAPFSSKGPTLDGRVKPDIAAPGSSIISAYSGAYYDAMNEDYEIDATFKTSLTIDGVKKTYYYGAMDGTSMASPFVTGVLATWLQADKTLTPEKVREILRETAIKDSKTGEIPETGNNRWGYGKIDAWEGVKKLLVSVGIENNFSENQSFCVLKSSLISNHKITVLFTSAQKSVTLQLFSLSGQKLVEKTYINPIPGQEESLDVSGLYKGVYVLSVSGENGMRNTHKVILTH